MQPPSGFSLSAEETLPSADGSKLPAGGDGHPALGPTASSLLSRVRRRHQGLWNERRSAWPGVDATRVAVNGGKRPHASLHVRRAGRTPRQGQDSGLWRPRLGQRSPEARNSGAQVGSASCKYTASQRQGLAGCWVLWDEEELERRGREWRQHQSPRAVVLIGCPQNTGESLPGPLVP